MSRNRLFGAALSLVSAAAAGWRGTSFSFGNLLDRYTAPPKRSTAQFSTTGPHYRKGPGLSIAQVKRAATKTKNRAKHRLACRRKS